MGLKWDCCLLLGGMNSNEEAKVGFPATCESDE